MQKSLNRTKKHIAAEPYFNNEIPLLIPQGSYLNEKLKFKTFQTMTSMRNVDAECMPYIFSNLDDESESI